MLPYYREGDYGQGLLEGTKALARVIAKDAGVEITGTILKRRPQRSRDTRFPAVLLLFLFFFGLIVFVLVRQGRQRNKIQFGGNIGRNRPCPCGSGKKYKMCHGKHLRKSLPVSSGGFFESVIGSDFVGGSSSGGRFGGGSSFGGGFGSFGGGGSGGGGAGRGY